MLQLRFLTTDARMVELARRYFKWIGPATAGEFQWFSGLGVKAAKAAIDAVGLSPLEPGSDLLIHPDEADACRRTRVPGKPQYSLVGSIDSLSLLRRDLPSLLDAADLKRRVHLYRDHQRDGYGAIVVQANIEDTRLGVQEYAI